MQQPDDITEKVREQGRRMTRQRRVVMETLAGLNTHPTAQELHELVRRQLPGISQATVYRNLKVLESLGYVVELDYGPGPAHYDATVTNHYHARCVKCGRVIDVDGGPIEDIDKLAETVDGWEITGHRLELYGTCPDCLKQRETGSKQEGTR